MYTNGIIVLIVLSTICAVGIISNLLFKRNYDNPKPIEKDYIDEIKYRKNTNKVLKLHALTQEDRKRRKELLNKKLKRLGAELRENEERKLYENFCSYYNLDTEEKRNAFENMNEIEKQKYINEMDKLHLLEEQNMVLNEINDGVWAPRIGIVWGT